MLKKIEIENFKRIDESPLILDSLAPINYLVGENGSGKSSVLELLVSLIHFKYNGEFVNYNDNYLNQILKLNNQNGKLIDDEYNSFFKKGFSMKFKNQDNELFAIYKNLKGGYSIDNEYCNKSLGYEVFSSKIIYSNPFFGNNFVENESIFLYNPLSVDYHKIFRTDNVDDIVRLYNEIVGDELNLELSIKKDGDTLTVLENGKVIQFEKIASGARTLFYLIGLLKDRLNVFNRHITRIIIEEPEISLHPKLIKRLPAIIEKIIKTLNLPNDLYQFFISTHSPFIINSALEIVSKYIDNNGVSRNVHKVYQITNGRNTDQEDDGLDKDRLDEIGKISPLYKIYGNLGMSPSDLLFSNKMIWVEGPADAIYIEFWLKKYIEEENENRADDKKFRTSPLYINQKI